MSKVKTSNSVNTNNETYNPNTYFCPEIQTLNSSELVAAYDFGREVSETGTGTRDRVDVITVFAYARVLNIALQRAKKAKMKKKVREEMKKVSRLVASTQWRVKHYRNYDISTSLGFPRDL
jgi:hypothetical protein